MQRFLLRFNPEYRVLSYTTFAGWLLDQAYDKIRHDTQLAVDYFSYLNFITDLSSNITCHLELDTLYLFLGNIPLNTNYVQALATYIVVQVRK